MNKTTGLKNMPDLNQNDILESLARDLLKEKRSDRRWKNFRFLVGFGLFAYFIFTIFHIMHAGPGQSRSPIKEGKYVAFIRLDGMIAPGREVSAEQTIPLLRDAF